MVELLAGVITLLATTVLTVAGVGAAFILIPVYLALGVELHTAMSTALLLNAIAMSFASITFARDKLILWRLAFPIIITATILAPPGAYFSQYVSRTVLLTLFVVFLVFAATMMLFFRQENAERRSHLHHGRHWHRLTLGGTVGGVAGFLGGLLGVGGGNVIVPVLVWLGIPPKHASATTSFVVIFSSLAGFAGRASLGSRKLQNRHVKVLIGVLLYVIAAKLLFDLYV